MAEYQPLVMPPSDRALSRKAAVVGIGESDYQSDYRNQRKPPPDYEPPTTEGLATLAFERALADSGLKRGDIDGLTGSFTYGGPPPAELASPCWGSSRAGTSPMAISWPGRCRWSARRLPRARPIAWR